jgi:hypothetical protein
MREKTVLPYGTWPSPITTALISQRLRLEDVQWAGRWQTLVWSEGRSGVTVLVAQTGGAARRSLTDEQSPRGGVGYGGGLFGFAHSRPAGLRGRDGRLYRRSLGLNRPRPLHPRFRSPPLAWPPGPLAGRQVGGLHLQRRQHRPARPG